MARRKTPSTEDIYVRVGVCIAALRRRRGLTQEALGMLADMSPNYIARVEGGYHHANFAKLAIIAEALGVSLASLLSTTDEPRTVAVPSSLVKSLGELSRDDQQLILQLARRLQARR